MTDAMGDSGDMRESESGEGMADGFCSPSPYHTGTTMPMMSLQGDMGPVFVQPIMDMTTNYMNDRPQSSTDMIAWDSTSLASSGGDHNPTRSSDHNGYRTPPAQGPTSA